VGEEEEGRGRGRGMCCGGGGEDIGWGGGDVSDSGVEGARRPVMVESGSPMPSSSHVWCSLALVRV